MVKKLGEKTPSDGAFRAYKRKPCTNAALVICIYAYSHQRKYQECLFQLMARCVTNAFMDSENILSDGCNLVNVLRDVNNMTRREKEALSKK